MCCFPLLDGSESDASCCLTSLNAETIVTYISQINWGSLNGSIFSNWLHDVGQLQILKIWQPYEWAYAQQKLMYYWIMDFSSDGKKGVEKKKGAVC